MLRITVILAAASIVTLSAAATAQQQPKSIRHASDDLIELATEFREFRSPVGCEFLFIAQMH